MASILLSENETTTVCSIVDNECPTPRAEQLSFVTLAYLAAFLLWGIFALVDFINERWRKINKTLLNGIVQLIIFVPSISYVIYYIVLQAIANQYSEMCSAIVAASFSIVHNLRTMIGLLQVKKLKNWIENLLDIMKKGGYAFNEDIDKFHLNNTLVDNEFIDTELPPRFRPDWNGYMLVTKDPVECFIRWSLSFIWQLGRDWLRDSYDSHYILNVSQMKEQGSADLFLRRLVRQSLWIGYNEQHYIDSPTDWRRFDIWARLILINHIPDIKSKIKLLKHKSLDVQDFEDDQSLPALRKLFRFGENDKIEQLKKHHYFIRRTFSDFPKPLLKQLDEKEVDMIDIFSWKDLNVLLIFSSLASEYKVMNESHAISDSSNIAIVSSSTSITVPITNELRSTDSIETVDTSDGETHRSDGIKPQSIMNIYPEDNVFDEAPYESIGEDAFGRGLLTTTSENRSNETGIKRHEWSLRKCPTQWDRFYRNVDPAESGNLSIDAMYEKMKSQEFEPQPKLSKFRRLTDDTEKIHWHMFNTNCLPLKTLMTQLGSGLQFLKCRESRTYNQLENLELFISRFPMFDLNLLQMVFSENRLLWGNDEFFEVSIHFDNLISIFYSILRCGSSTLSRKSREIISQIRYKSNASRSIKQDRIRALKKHNEYFYDIYTSTNFTTDRDQETTLSFLQDCIFCGCGWRLLSSQLNCRIFSDEERRGINAPELLTIRKPEDGKSPNIRFLMSQTVIDFHHVLGARLVHDEDIYPYSFVARLIWDCQDHCYNWLNHRASQLSTSSDEENQRNIYYVLLFILYFPLPNIQINQQHNRCGVYIIPQFGPQRFYLYIELVFTIGIEGCRHNVPIPYVSISLKDSISVGSFYSTQTMIETMNVMETETSSSNFNVVLNGLQASSSSSVIFNLREWEAAVNGRLMDYDAARDLSSERTTINARR